MELASSRCSASRTWRMTRRDAAGMVALIIVRSGREQIEVGDERLILGPGDAALWDPHEPTRFEVVEPVTKLNLLCPRDVASSLAAGRRKPGRFREGPIHIDAVVCGGCWRSREWTCTTPAG
ncbi:MAG: AraC family ligand binding domain-containing protein [Sciscionella sp.]